MLIIRLFIAFALVCAIARLPYFYYQLLRVFVTIFAGFNIASAYALNKRTWLIIFAIIALLFNPIFPIYLPKNVWVRIDLIVAGLFIASIFTLKYEES